MQHVGDVGLSAEFADVRSRLASWRQTSGGRGRSLPEELWDAAVQLAKEATPGVVARALRLNPDSLARRMSGGSDGRFAGPSRRSVFVEVAPPPIGAITGGCRIELLGSDGTRVSIQLDDSKSVDLVALAGGLLRGGR